MPRVRGEAAPHKGVPEPQICCGHRLQPRSPEKPASDVNLDASTARRDVPSLGPQGGALLLLNPTGRNSTDIFAGIGEGVAHKKSAQTVPQSQCMLYRQACEPAGPSDGPPRSAPREKGVASGENSLAAASPTHTSTSPLAPVSSRLNNGEVGVRIMIPKRRRHKKHPKQLMQTLSVRPPRRQPAACPSARPPTGRLAYPSHAH